MTYMTDTGRSAALLNYAISGGAAATATQPLMLRLMTTQATGNGNVNGTNGTEMTTEYGYTALGSTLGASVPFGTFPASTATQTNANAVSWSATGTWPAIPAIEIWDSPPRNSAGSRAPSPPRYPEWSTAIRSNFRAVL